MRDITLGHGIHVVNDESVEDVIALDPEVAAQISRNNVLSNVTPLRGCIELLVNVAIIPKGFSAHRSSQSKIVIAFFKGFESLELGICPNHRTFPRAHVLHKIA